MTTEGKQKLCREKANSGVEENIQGIEESRGEGEEQGGMATRVLDDVAGTVSPSVAARSGGGAVQDGVSAGGEDASGPSLVPHDDDVGGKSGTDDSPERCNGCVTVSRNS